MSHLKVLAKQFRSHEQAELEAQKIRSEGRTLAHVVAFEDPMGVYYCVNMGPMPEQAERRNYWLGENGKAV